MQTPEKPEAATAEIPPEIPSHNAITSDAAAPPLPAAPNNSGDRPIVISSVLGAVEPLTDIERGDFFACEEVVSVGWSNFAEVGLALAQIRDRGLYREEFATFETYCRNKWEYGRRYVALLISAAQVFNYLRTNSSQKTPDHETQVRPLVGLARDKAKLVWDRAVEKAGKRKITAKIVKAMVVELGLQPPPVNAEAKQARIQRRQMVADGLKELLALIQKKEAHQVLLEKAQILGWRIDGLLTGGKSASPRVAETSAA